MKERITKTNIELLCKDLYMYSLKKKKSDNIIEFQNYYDSLLSKIFDEYRKQKKHENIIEDKKYKRLKKRNLWIINQILKYIYYKRL